MPERPKLTPVSYIVLGLVAGAGRATPYDLKRMVAGGLGDFWSVQHAQLYTETARLAAAGMLTEEREPDGRRRKVYELTAAGRAALSDWLATPARDFTELRDLGLLKLYFGADPRALAPAQLELHEAKLAEYEALRRAGTDAPAGALAALEAGIGHEREWVRFWRRLAKGQTPG